MVGKDERSVLRPNPKEKCGLGGEAVVWRDGEFTRILTGCSSAR